MTLRKRWRVIWAALTQEWEERVCQCGQRFYTHEIAWSDLASKCAACEEQEMQAWINRYQARHGGQKEIA